MANHHDRACAFGCWLQDCQIEHTMTGNAWTSAYYHIQAPADAAPIDNAMPGPSLTIRISDHAPAVDDDGQPRGGYVQAGMADLPGLHGVTYSPADISVHPGGHTIRQAQAAVLAHIGPHAAQIAKRNARAAKDANYQHQIAYVRHCRAEAEVALAADPTPDAPYWPNRPESRTRREQRLWTIQQCDAYLAELHRTCRPLRSMSMV